MVIVTKPASKNSVQNQLLATMIVNFTNILYGFAAGWTSSSFLILESSETSPMLQGALNQEERSWVTSLFAISGVVGTFFYYWIADIFGRKFGLCFIAIPHAICWILIEFGVYPWQLYIARVLSGLGSGGAFSLVPLYVSEICEPHVRGRLGSLMMLCANAGFLISFLAGNYMQYHQIPYIGLGISIAYLLAILYFPETPQFLLKSKKDELAEQSYRFYRNLPACSELTEKRKSEWEVIKNVDIKMGGIGHGHGASPSSAGTDTSKINATDTDAAKQSNWTDLFKTRPGRKAFLIGMALISMHELCGCFTMLNYTATIFRESGSTISPNFSAVIVGFIQLLGTYVATFSVDRFGRKVLLISSSIGSAVCLCGLGTYSYLNSIGVDVSMYSWMAIVSFSGMMFLAAIGLIPLMPVVISEVMPEQVRDIGCTICFCMSWVLAFIMVKFFESVAEVFGMHGWVFFFAGSTLIGALFTVFWIPETKGKTYAEIEAILNR